MPQLCLLGGIVVAHWWVQASLLLLPGKPPHLAHSFLSQGSHGPVLCSITPSDLVSWGTLNLCREACPAKAWDPSSRCRPGWHRWPDPLGGGVCAPMSVSITPLCSPASPTMLKAQVWLFHPQWPRMVALGLVSAGSLGGDGWAPQLGDLLAGQTWNPRPNLNPKVHYEWNHFNNKAQPRGLHETRQSAQAWHTPGDPSRCYHHGISQNWSWESDYQ